MNQPTRCLIFDPFAGISGDMILGALVDLGLEQEWLVELVGSLPVQAKLSVDSVTRGTLMAKAVRVELTGSEKPRRLADLLQIVEQAAIGSAARQTAAATFRRLAEVEGALHGLPADEVHFHEVGGDDAIVDIVGACAAIERLEIHQCYTRPVSVGYGWVTAQHGPLPVPAPATLKLLEGLPVRDSTIEGELTTPTGAALLASLTEARPAPGIFVPVRSGYGAGSRDPDSHPNCLRVVLAQLAVEGALLTVQADIDDMSPEYLPPLLEALYLAGATDVWSYPIQMKKGRSGLRIEVLVSVTAREEVCRALFKNSTTIGLRFWPVDREVLPRATKTIEWRGFSIRIKTSSAPDGHVHCKPEYDDVVAAAQALGWPAIRVQQEIEQQLRKS